jgi:hypothetical protein
MHKTQLHAHTSCTTLQHTYTMTPLKIFRFVGTMKSYLNARNNSHAGMVYGYTQKTFVARTDPALVRGIMARFQERNIVPAERSISTPFNHLLLLRGDRPGSGKFGAKPTWRTKTNGDAATIASFGAFLRLMISRNSPHVPRIAARDQYAGMPSRFRSKVITVSRGIKINGRPWQEGTACLWLNEVNTYEFGYILGFISWTEGANSVWCARVKQHTVAYEENRVLYALAESDSSEEYIFWQQLRYLCKVDTSTTPHAAVRMYSTTSSEECD